MSSEKPNKSRNIVDFNVLGPTDALASVLRTQDMAARMFRNALPPFNVTHDFARAFEAHNVVSWFRSDQAAAIKGLQMNWAKGLLPTIILAQGIARDTTVSFAFTQGPLIKGIQVDWARTVLPDITQLANYPLFSVFSGIEALLGEQLRGFLSGIDWVKVQRRARIPSNWPEDFEEHLLKFQAMLNDEALPLAWVPRLAIVMKLLAADTAAERIEILRRRREDILEDCAELVMDLDDNFMSGQLPLAREVIETCRLGKWRAGAALAVDVVHGIVERLDWKTNARSVRAHYTFTLELTLDELIAGVTKASLVAFYEEWHEKSGRPMPQFLARHVVSHSVSDEHLSDHNCLIAVMLMASLMETVYQLELGRPAEIAA